MPAGASLPPSQRPSRPASALAQKNGVAPTPVPATPPVPSFQEYVIEEDTPATPEPIKVTRAKRGTGKKKRVGKVNGAEPA
jgi:hypothetical protein